MLLVRRREAGPLKKPHIAMQQKPERTVRTKIYPVPRIDVDALLAIEAAPPHSAQSKPTVVSEKTEPKSGSSQRSASVSAPNNRMSPHHRAFVHYT